MEIDLQVQKLIDLGFGQYEARAYVALLKQYPLNGYELAKLSGIPRANIYGVLQKLVDHGAALRIDTPEGKRYLPVQPDELIQKLNDSYKETLENARQSLASLCIQQEGDYAWNVQGYEALIEHARQLIDKAEDSLLVAINPNEAPLLGPYIAKASERGVKIITHCMAGCAEACGHCHGQVFRIYVPEQENTRWLVLIPDESEVLAGQIDPQGEALGVRASHHLLVNLAAGYIRNSLSLSTLLEKLGEQLNVYIDKDVIKSLETLAPTHKPGNWLKNMKNMLTSTSPENNFKKG